MLTSSYIWRLQSNWIFFFSFTEEFQSCEAKLINKDPYSIFKESIWTIQTAWWTMDGLWYCTGNRDQDHPKKKKCKKAKWLSEEALQIAVKITKVKSKGKKERYTHLSAEFQRIARRDKKAILSDQCKEIEENNRMEKTRDLFKKIKKYWGNISCKDWHNKDRNGMDLTEAEDIKKMCQE